LQLTPQMKSRSVRGFLSQFNAQQKFLALWVTATHGNTLQHTATYCNTFLALWVTARSEPDPIWKNYKRPVRQFGTPSVTFSSDCRRACQVEAEASS